MTPPTFDAVRVHESLGLEQAYRRLIGDTSHSPARDPLADDIRNRLNDTTTPPNGDANESKGA